MEEGTFRKFSALTSSQKLLLVGNMSTVVGVAIVSLGSVLRMLESGELPSQPVFTSGLTPSQENRDYRNNHNSSWSQKDRYFN